MKPDHVVIAGGGLAGHRALHSLRTAGFVGRVTLVCDEKHRPYDRPPLSKRVLLGTMAPEATYYDCADLEVDWLLGRRAAALDVAGSQITLSDGQTIDYDGLVIATGRRARRWPDLPPLRGFHVIRSLDDAVAFRAAITHSRNVAIVGAGFIGCEVAAALRRQEVEGVTLIDLLDRPLAALGEAAGEFARRIHEAEGVRFKLGAHVAGFEGAEGKVIAVHLHDDEPIPADLVLLALGSVPNSEWLERSGLQLHRGAVRCDAHCIAVGTDNVVAAGDIAAWPHPHAGEAGVTCVEHWSTAREMGKLAAENLIAEPGKRVAFNPVPTFWSDQYDVKMKSAGLLNAADRFEVVELDEQRRRLIVEAFRGDEFVGAVVFNRNKTIVDYQRRLRANLDTAPLATYAVSDRSPMRAGSLIRPGSLG